MFPQQQTRLFICLLDGVSTTVTITGVDIELSRVSIDSSVSYLT